MVSSNVKKRKRKTGRDRATRDVVLIRLHLARLHVAAVALRSSTPAAEPTQEASAITYVLTRVAALSEALQEIEKDPRESVTLDLFEILMVLEREVVLLQRIDQLRADPKAVRS